MKKDIIRIAIVVGMILVVPLLENLFIDGWDWGIGGFIFAFVMLFSAGLAFDFAARKLANPIYRGIAITTIVLALLVIWVEIVVEDLSIIYKQPYKAFLLLLKLVTG